MTEDGPSPALIPELSCSNVRNSLWFYTEVLGFRVEYQRPEDGFAMLERQGARIMLDEIRRQAVTGTDRTWLSGPLEHPYGRGVNLQIETTDVDALHARVRQSGARIFLELEEKWYRADDRQFGNRQFIVQDPDGYLLRFFQDLGARKLP